MLDCAVTASLAILSRMAGVPHLRGAHQITVSSRAISSIVSKHSKCLTPGPRESFAFMSGLKPWMACKPGVVFDELLSLPAQLQRPNILDLCRNPPDKQNHMRTDRAAMFIHAIATQECQPYTLTNTLANVSCLELSYDSSDMQEEI